MKKLAVLIAAVPLAVAGYATASAQKGSHEVTANLKPRFEVPRPKGTRPGATGLFTGKAVELANDKAKLTWRLTFSKLTGPGIAAHIHAANPGKAGPVLLALCGPCKSGQRGTATISHADLATLERGGAYVNVHTAKNPGGEIRGQVKVSGDGSSVDSTSSSTTTTTSTTPYP